MSQPTNEQLDNIDSVVRFYTWRAGNQMSMSREDREDLAQDLYVRLLGLVDKYEEGLASFKTWCEVHAKYEIIDWSRRSDWYSRKYRKQHPDRQMVLIGDGFNLPERRVHCDKVAIRDEAETILRRLPSHERFVLRMHYMEERTLKEIGAILGRHELSVGITLRKGVARARGEVACRTT